VGTVLGLLFDLDGTLVSTKEANYCSYRDAFAEFGHFLSREEFEGTWGRDSRDFVPEILPDLPADDCVALRVRKSVLYEKYLGQTVPNTPLIEFVKLVAPTHRTALVSTAKSVNARQIISVHGLENLFDVLVFGDELTRSKPDPEGYNKALARLGLDPADCVAFEDSATGHAAATAAGLKVITVPPFE
jgi:beta-phosphoglucomutase-like phosphatase (HAD superfamily)